MAYVFGNVNSTNNSGSNEGGFANSNYVLKDDVKSDWYMYRASDKSVVRPYPVYDSNGIPCPLLGAADPENPYSIFSDAFAVVPLVVFAGLDGKLQFIDYCSDLDKYAPPGVSLTRTPYSFLITKLREMLPEKDRSTTKSGLPTPPRLGAVAKNIHYSSTALMFRGALVRAKGKPSASKHAVNGVMFKAIYYVAVKSAIDSFIAELKKPKDPRFPWSQDNSAANGLFELDGLTIQFDKSGPANADPYRVSFGYEPTYKAAAMQFFNIPEDPMHYHNAVRTLYGPNQQLSDIFNILTVEDMVKILKESFPISWVYYGLKDSPFASLLTGDDREAAFRDPELAMWFGVPGGPSENVSGGYPTGASTYPTPSTNSYPAPNPGYPTQPASYPAPAPQPSFAPPTYQTDTPMGPAPTPAAPPANDKLAGVASRVAFWNEQFAQKSTAGEPDGLRY